MNDAHRLAADLLAAANAFDDDTAKLLAAVGVELEPKVPAAVRGDIGDTSMSNWRRGNPIQIGGRSTADADRLTVEPFPKGPMRVLDSGRKAAPRRGRKGRIGATRGKGTWGDAEVVMERTVPTFLEKLIDEAAKRVLGG